MPEALNEKRLTMEQLESRWREVLAEIATEGTVYLITAKVPEAAGLLPAGMVAEEELAGFVLGPAQICGQGLALVDPEYGWPVLVRPEDVTSAWDLAPGRRRHPFIKVGEAIVVSVMASEYERIRSRPGGEGAPSR